MDRIPGVGKPKRLEDNLSDDLVYRGVIIAMRQYPHFGKFAPNESEFRESAISWLKEALGRLEGK